MEAGGILEFRVHQGKGTKFADLLWRPRLLLEMKKRGERLERHYRQAFEYWLHLVPKPRRSSAIRLTSQRTRFSRNLEQPTFGMYAAAIRRFPDAPTIASTGSDAPTMSSRQDAGPASSERIPSGRTTRARADWTTSSETGGPLPKPFQLKCGAEMPKFTSPLSTGSREISPAKRDFSFRRATATTARGRFWRSTRSIHLYLRRWTS
jgi:hypothetical protein